VSTKNWEKKVCSQPPLVNWWTMRSPYLWIVNQVPGFGFALNEIDLIYSPYIFLTPVRKVYLLEVDLVLVNLLCLWILFYHFNPILSFYSYSIPWILFYPLIPIISLESYSIPWILFYPLNPILSFDSYYILWFLLYPLIPIISLDSYSIPWILFYP